ncbi:MAG: type II secretion system F family protein [Planctomycetota bacterium]
MTEVFVGAGAAAGAGALYWWWHVRRLHALARARLGDDLNEREAAHVVEVLPSLRRRMWIPWTAGIAAAAVLYFALGLWVTYSVAIGVILGTVAFLIEQHIAARNALKVETQLANAIDLMVGALGAGAGFSEAIESAASESQKPLKAELNEVLGRIRYGEAPKQVWDDFSTRIPLETFRLFCFTLAVHGEVGGSLTPTLSSVGKSIRDRIEISRRIRAQSTEAQGSVIGIVCITYFLGLMMWRTNPQSFEEFLRNPIGANMVAAALVLQAIGLVWITKLAQLRF